MRLPLSAALLTFLAGCNGASLSATTNSEPATNTTLPTRPHCPHRETIVSNLPDGETFQTICPAPLSTDAPTGAALERALTLLWDQREGNAELSRPAFDFAASCDEDVFQLADDGHAVVAWRGSLACSHGFVRTIYEWNEIARWGATASHAAQDEATLGDRTEELMTGVLIANQL